MSLRVDTSGNSLADLEAEFELNFNKPSLSKYVRNKNIKGKHKKFDYQLHYKYDVPARNKVKEVLGDFVKDNPDEYQQDMIITSPTCRYKYLEIQVVSRWIGERYPYNTVYIYERKAKYGEDTLFLTLNRDLTKGFIFDNTSIKGTNPRRFKKYSREFVYDIPWCNVMTIYMSQLDKETVELY